MIVGFIYPINSPPYVHMPFFLQLQNVPVSKLHPRHHQYLSGKYCSTIIMNPTKSINMALTIHRVNDTKQSLLIDQHWEVSDPILPCSNLQDLPMHFFGNPEEFIFCFHVWDSGLPLCIAPQGFHFPELVAWCAEHFSLESNSVVSE